MSTVIVMSTAELLRLAVIVQRSTPQPIAPQAAWAKIAFAHGLYAQGTDFRLDPAVEAELEASVVACLGLTRYEPPSTALELRHRVQDAEAESVAGAAETSELREEVGYWRRDAAARIWWHQGLLAAARKDGDEVNGRGHYDALRSAVAASEAVIDRRWHERCELCGAEVRPGQATSPTDEEGGGLAHLGCVSDADDGPDGPDPTEADWRARAAEGRAALVQDDADESAAETLDACVLAWGELLAEGRNASVAAEEGWCVLGPVHNRSGWCVERTHDAYLWDTDAAALGWVRERAANGSELHRAAAELNDAQVAAWAAAERKRGRAGAAP